MSTMPASSAPPQLPPAVASSPAPRSASRVPSSFAPLLLTPLVLFVSGFHPFAGDAGIYVAGVRHILAPSLYPLNAAFPAAFTQLSVLPWILAALARVTHLPLAWILLAAHLLSIYLFLFACCRLAGRLFDGEAERWCSVVLAAACFTLPVAGTALFIMDPYVTARSFSTPLSLLAVAACVDRAWSRTILLLAMAFLVHPLMGLYASTFVLLAVVVAARRMRVAVALCFALLAIAGIAFLLGHRTPLSPAYRQAIDLPQRTFLFLARWRWYEVLGLLGPLLLCGIALRGLRARNAARALCLASVLFGITSLLIAAIFVPANGPYVLVPLQVLRSFHVIYAVGIVMCGAVLARLVTRFRVTAVSLLFLLFAVLFSSEPVAWPDCNRIEWPGRRPANPWQQAFLWIRDNTPRNAVFAFNPQLVYLPEEDEQGFRATTERDHLADDKDAGIVAVLPRLADRWAAQRNAQANIDRMTDSQRVAALSPQGATWLLLPPSAETAFPCPYENSVAKVCRLPR